eukprot:gene1731-16216_t
MDTALARNVPLALTNPILAEWSVISVLAEEHLAAKQAQLQSQNVQPILEKFMPSEAENGKILDYGVIIL